MANGARRVELGVEVEIGLDVDRLDLLGVAAAEGCHQGAVVGGPGDVEEAVVREVQPAGGGAVGVPQAQAAVRRFT